MIPYSNAIQRANPAAHKYHSSLCSQQILMQKIRFGHDFGQAGWKKAWKSGGFRGKFRWKSGNFALKSLGKVAKTIYTCIEKK